MYHDSLIIKILVDSLWLTWLEMSLSRRCYKRLVLVFAREAGYMRSDFGKELFQADNCAYVSRIRSTLMNWQGWNESFELILESKGLE